MEIKKELEKPKSKKGKGKYKRPAKQPVIQNKKSNKDTYIPRMHYEEKKSYGNLILIFIVVLLILYLLYK